MQDCMIFITKSLASKDDHLYFLWYWDQKLQQNEGLALTGEWWHDYYLALLPFSSQEGLEALITLESSHTMPEIAFNTLLYNINYFMINYMQRKNPHNCLKN